MCKIYALLFDALTKRGRIIMNTGADKEKIIPPFKMAANLYFVGTYEASSHLIATKEGLILIDAGYPQTADVIANGIKTLGFDIENLKDQTFFHPYPDGLIQVTDSGKSIH